MLLLRTGCSRMQYAFWNPFKFFMCRGFKSFVDIVLICSCVDVEVAGAFEEQIK